MNVTWTFLFFFKQKTAYEMRISDWSSDVCSSDLTPFTCTLPPFIFSRPGLPMKASPRLFAAFAAIFAFLLPLAALAQERGLELDIVGGNASALPIAVLPMPYAGSGVAPETDVAVVAVAGLAPLGQFPPITATARDAKPDRKRAG